MANEDEMRAYLLNILNQPGVREELSKAHVIFGMLMGDRLYTREEIENFMSHAQSFLARNRDATRNEDVEQVMQDLDEATNHFTNQGEIALRGGSAGRMLDFVFGKVALMSHNEKELYQVPQAVEALLGFGLIVSRNLDYSAYQLDVGVAVKAMDVNQATLRLVYRPVPKTIMPTRRL